jgi:hypothetical protein
LRFGWSIPLVFVASSAFAQTYRIPREQPTSMEDIERVLNDEIPNAMDGAMCGGWDADQSVGFDPGPGGKISLVTGVPGRLGDPLRNLLSGMAWRKEEGGAYNDGFEFPDTATGLSTTCDKETRTVQRWVWTPLDGSAPGHYEMREIENPYFEDPPCDAYPDASGNQSPAECQAFCDWLNTFTYEDCRVFTRNDEGRWICVETGFKYTCSEEWETEPVGGRKSSSMSDRSKSSAMSKSSDASMSFPNVIGSSSSFSFPNIIDSSSSFSFPNIIGGSSSSFSFPNIIGGSSSSSFSLPNIIERSSSSASRSSGVSQSASSPQRTQSSESSKSFDNPFIPDSSSSKGDIIRIPDDPGFPDLPDPPPVFPNPPPEPPAEPDPPLLNPIVGTPPEKPTPSVENTEPLPADDGGGFFQNVWQGILNFFSPGGAQLIETTPLDEFADQSSQSSDVVTPIEVQLPVVDQSGSSESRSVDAADDQEGERVTAEGGFVPNCVKCEGQNCRCPGPDCFTLPSREERDEPSPLPQRYEKVYPSFYRHYDSVTERDALDEAKPNDDVLRSTETEIACYGFYDEFDPKTKKTAGPRDEQNPGDTAKRCSIAFAHPRQELLETQSVIATTAPFPATTGAGLPSREPTETWYPLLGGMSFLRESAGTDVGAAFSNLDDATMVATPQLSNDRPYAENLNLHGGDETVTNETGASQYFVQWLHSLQADMVNVLTPPEVRMRIPASWLPNMPADTEIVEVNPGIDETTGNFDPRHASVDVQIKAGEDVQGILLKELGKMFAIREEVIPAVIPAGSPQEFRDRALQWRDYIRHRELLGLPYPSEAWQVVSDLEKYKEQIEKYRGLRAQLSETVSSLLNRRENDLSAIADWMEQLVNRYEQFDAERTERLALASDVKNVQAEIAKFDDDVNAQWCRQDHFTTPIYSLLHAWYPGSPDLRPPTSCDGSDGTLPLLCMPEEKDLFIDFSTLVTSTQPLRIPVLHIVQILPELPSPPDENGPAPYTLTALPDLPPLPTIDVSDLSTIGTVSVARLPAQPEFPEQMDLDALKTSLHRAQTLLQGRNAAYDEFWKSLEPPDASFWEMLGLGGDESERRLTCSGWNSTPCVHVEMDLLERMTRITAMPGVYLRENLLVRGAPRTSTDETDPENTIACDPANDLCAPPLHRVIKQPPVGFQVEAPETNARWDQALERIRTNVREGTIDQNGKQTGDVPFPYVGRPEQLYDSFTVPPDVDLLPSNQ